QPYFGTYGGGAASCTLNNCTLTGNKAEYVYNGGLFHGDAYGGGAAYCTLNNCTLYDNVAGIFPDGGGYGGGAYGCRQTNCIVYRNYAGSGANFDGSSTCSYCWSADPLFEAAGIPRLQPNSPCINAGNNSYVMSATDLGGSPRISCGTGDIAAYEFQWS